MGSLDEWLLPASAGTKTGLSIAQVNEAKKRQRPCRTESCDGFVRLPVGEVKPGGEIFLTKLSGSNQSCFPGISSL